MKYEKKTKINMENERLGHDIFEPVDVVIQVFDLLITLLQGNY
jgi:hypothetical protein